MQHSERLNERQQLIVDQLEVDGEIRISDMKDKFQVAEMTIRRDLEKLEKAGIARRIFGGAILLEKDMALQERLVIMAKEKKIIGRKAASFIKPGDCIFIDGGTTTVEVARALKPGFEITAVTNALNVANELLDKEIHTIVSGGTILKATSTLIGPLAVDTVGSLAYTRVFLGTTGLSAQHGFSNSNMYETEIKKAVIRQGEEVNIVVDSTKYGAKELVSFATLADAHRMITDRRPDADLFRACRDAGINIVTAEG